MNNIPPGQISDLPLREANTRGSVHITGVINGRKAPLPMGRIGAHERQFIIRAELDPRITRIRYQPVWYEIPDGKGGVTTAWPDFCIDIDGVQEIHEVKSDDQYQRPDIRQRISTIARVAARHGHRYSITLASDLHRKSDKPSIDMLWRRIGRKVGPDLLSAARSHLANGPVAVGQLVWALGRQNCHIVDVHAMIAAGDLVADLRTKPDEHMIVHARDGAPAFDRLIPFTDPLGRRS